MKAYELLFFCDPTIKDDAYDALVNRLSSVITDGKGEIDSTDRWGKRKLAYEIDKLSDGDYTLINFHADPTQISELNRVCRITDAIKRHMIVVRPENSEK